MRDLKEVLYDKECLQKPYFRFLLSGLDAQGVRTEEITRPIGDARGVLVVCANEDTVRMALEADAAYVCCGISSRDAQCIIEGFDEVDADFLEKMYERKHRIPWEIARTERLRIREFCREDRRDILPELSTDPDFTEKYIENMYGFFGYGIWAAVLKETGEIIGRVGFYDSSSVDGFEIGYAIDEPYRRRGYAFEACRAAIDFAENRLGQEKIYALIELSNDGSMRLAESLGFRDTGKTVWDKSRAAEELKIFLLNLC